MTFKKRMVWLTTLLAMGSIFAVMECSIGYAQQADIVIRNGIIHDGTGNDPVIGFVSIQDGKITGVGSGPGPDGRMLIDAKDLVIAPGFIDLHTHSDSAFASDDLKVRAAECYLLQGCTTSVTGNCGMGPIEVKAFYDKVDQHGTGTNVAHLLPYGTVRSTVVGGVNRKPTPEEMERIRDTARTAMKEGAWGMATGLIYTPNAYAETAELIEAAREIAAGGGIYASHIRGEDERLLGATQEALQIGREGGLPVHISHMKVKDRPNWGHLKVSIAMIEAARQQGQKVTADQYPYIAASTSLEATIFPVWSRSGGIRALVRRLDEEASRARIQQEVEKILTIMDQGKQLVIARFSKRPAWTGKNLKEIADAEGKSPWEIAEFIIKNGGAAIVNFAMNEDDVRMAMTFPWVATASDGYAQLPGPDRPHPRSFGTFPRKIGYYSIRENVIPLEAAIRSCTGLPADIIGMKDRGYLKVGQAADIVVFDPKSFIDQATFDHPTRLATGVRYLFVNGKFAVKEGEMTKEMAGRSLRKPHSAATVSVAP